MKFKKMKYVLALCVSMVFLNGCGQSSDVNINTSTEFATEPVDLTNEENLNEESSDMESSIISEEEDESKNIEIDTDADSVFIISDGSEMDAYKKVLRSEEKIYDFSGDEDTGWYIKSILEVIDLGDEGSNEFEIAFKDINHDGTIEMIRDSFYPNLWIYSYNGDKVITYPTEFYSGCLRQDVLEGGNYSQIDTTHAGRGEYFYGTMLGKNTLVSHFAWGYVYDSYDETLPKSYFIETQNTAPLKVDENAFHSLTEFFEKNRSDIDIKNFRIEDIDTYDADSEINTDIYAVTEKIDYENETSRFTVTFKDGETTEFEIPYYMPAELSSVNFYDMDGDLEDELVLQRYFGNTAGDYNWIFVIDLKDHEAKVLDYTMTDGLTAGEIYDGTIVKTGDSQYATYGLFLVSYEKDGAGSNIGDVCLVAMKDGKFEIVKSFGGSEELLYSE